MTTSQMSLNSMSLFALKMETGYALVMAGRLDNGKPFFAAADDEYAVAFRLKAGTVSQIMLNVRRICAQAGSGHLNFDMKMPLKAAATLPVMAAFDVLSGCVESVADTADGVWDDLRKAAKPISFLSTPSDLRLARNLAHEVLPGVMQTPYGELAVHDGSDWVPLDHLNAHAVSEVLIPKLEARRKKGDWAKIYQDLIRVVPPYVVDEAMEDYHEDAFDFINGGPQVKASMSTSPVNSGPVVDLMNDRDELDGSEDEDPDFEI